MKKLFLISCVKTKLSRPAPAADLYTSKWFTKARCFAEKHQGAEWFILSAKHDLLPPDKVIEPYERTLNTMGTAERRAWAERVQHQMDSDLPDADEVIVLAGEKYRKYLLSYLERRFPKVSIPMKGKRNGEQMQWLNEQLAAMQ